MTEPITKPAWRDSLEEGAFNFVVTAAFPRLAYWLRWSTRLGLRGLIAYVAFKTLLIFALRTLSRRILEMRERAERELRESLGREPTKDEVFAHLMQPLYSDVAEPQSATGSDNKRFAWRSTRNQAIAKAEARMGMRHG